MKVNIGKYPKGGGKQRVKVVIEPQDLCSTDCTLALVIRPLLEAFKASNTGFPGQLTAKKWDKILDQMIWSFREIETGGIFKDHSFVYTQKVQDGLDLFGKYYQHLWT